MLSQADLQCSTSKLFISIICLSKATGNNAAIRNGAEVNFPSIPKGSDARIDWYGNLNPNSFKDISTF